MKLIVGLGNPGAKYAGHRHNIGFMALDMIAADHGFGPWKGKHNGAVSEGRFGSDRAALLKPETFMNNSGQSVQAAMRFYKLTPEDVIVLHDEIDLAPGKVKYKMGGGHAGHNGLRSIHQHIGPEYGRVRLGVGHPGHKDRVPGYVLHDFARADQDWLDDVLRGCADGAPHLATGDSAKFMNAVGMRVSPQRPSSGTKAPNKTSAKTASKTAAKPSGEAPKTAPEATPDTRNAMQKLMDKFK
ncbi:aminoacyl-tRNA hydrolase [Ascidiaceihabitans sp.]|uniref:aminoacyl-tRNA hydrolase n=1 Tax=Ascidiaceihabitans sp. TaxID=1872644 RepID=UPI0032984186